MHIDHMRKETREHIEGLGGIRSMDNHPMPEAELRQIEESIGGDLPSSLQLILLDYGAFRFQNEVMFVALESDPSITTSCLGVFFGAEVEGRRGLSYYIRMFKNRMPHTIIPIGNNLFGDKFCLGIQGNEQGKLYYWYHENEPDRQEYWARHGQGVPLSRAFLFQNVFLIANTFDEFICSLAIDEEAYT
jgi:SMI1-KNR4 cell-wall